MQNVENSKYFNEDKIDAYLTDKENEWNHFLKNTWIFY